MIVRISSNLGDLMGGSKAKTTDENGVTETIEKWRNQEFSAQGKVGQQVKCDGLNQTLDLESPQTR